MSAEIWVLLKRSPLCPFRLAPCRGRDAEAPPAQIPACGLPAPGSSVTLASALTNSGKHHLPMPTLRDPGLLQRKSLHQGVELLPIHPALLTPPPQPLLQQPSGLIEECAQAPGVADHPVVIIVPTKPGVQRLDQLTNRRVTLSLEPLGQPSQRCPKPLARRPAGHPRHSLVVNHPKRFLCVGFSITYPIAACIFNRPFGAVPDFREVRPPLRPTWFPVYASSLSFGSSFDSPPTGLQHSVRVAG